MTTVDVKTFLETLQNQVAGESLEQLLAIAKSLTLSKGTVLMQEGKSHDYFT